ncbi:peptidase family C50-domain-containing protein [Phellopilus nigrolimitatus]|nr:peptidase family C50-domain-containing protein [Phellopilus nigrolimitatus]
MATTRVKRPLAPRTNEVDRLANKLASGLRISEAANARIRKAKSRPAESPEEARAAAMRTVNGALESLSEQKNGGGKSSASPSATGITGRTALSTLRKLSPGMLGVERAALNLAGKLLALDAFELALDLLTDIWTHLPSYYEHVEIQSTHEPPLSILRLPLPTSPLDSAFQTCVSAYFSHVIPAVAHAIASQSMLYDDFCDALHSLGSLPSWMLHLTSLPTKALDALLKRTYVVLTSSLASPPAMPVRIFKVRFCALALLLVSTELDVTPFWEQCLNYAASYARNAEAAEQEKEKIAELLASFENVVRMAEGRQEGKGWIKFCEYWLALAKRSGNLSLVNRVAAYIRKEASSSNDATLLAARSCAALTQLASAMESEGTDQDELISYANSSASYLHDVDGSLLDSKLHRVIEKCRRSGLKALARPLPGSLVRDAVRRVLGRIVDVYERLLDDVAENNGTATRTDTTIAVLDTLFQLATAVVDPQRADTCDQAYDYLARAAHIIERGSASDKSIKTELDAQANYTRCLAGAFANVAGGLYRTERHSFAIRFLLQACPLSLRASTLHDEVRSRESKGGKGKAREEPEKDQEIWKTHRAHVYRRWELLGACYTKTGDRKLAYNAFVQGVGSYPFEDGLALTGAADAGADETFASEAQRPLASAIDRLTHLGAVELYLPAEKVSLLQPLRARGVSPLALGAVLMRQVHSLAEHRAKPAVRIIVEAILKDLLAVYEPTRHAVRRARVLILVLENAYFGAADEKANRSRVEESAREVQKLLSNRANLCEDASLAHFRPYYHAMARLWVVLHAHRAADPAADILSHTRASLDTLSTLIEQPCGNAVETTIDASSADRGRKVGRPKVGEAKAATSTTRGRARSTRAPQVETQTATSTARGRARSTRPPQVETQVARKVRATTSESRKPPMTRKPGAKGNVETKAVANVAQKQVLRLSVAELLTLTGLMHMVSELLGLSGLVLAKMQMLNMTRRLLEKTGELTSEAYLQACAIFAHELLKLGKTEQAIGVLASLASSLTKARLSSPAAVLLLLRFAEALAFNGDLPRSLAVYEEASRLCDDLPEDEKGKGLSTSARVRARVIVLERAAVAANIFAAIQDLKDEPVTSLRALLQALRLLNRATDTLSKLNPVKKPQSSPEPSDPFAMSDLKDALPNANVGGSQQSSDKVSESKAAQPRSNLDGLEWRVANALFGTMLALADAYARRGSPRDAEYFAQQAADLADVLRAPVMTARALLRKSEIQLAMGQFEEAQKSLVDAAALVEDVGGLEVADMRRLRGDVLLRQGQDEEAQSEYAEASKILAESALEFNAFDAMVSVSESSEPKDAFVPVLNAMILRQHVWLLRDELGESYQRLLEQLLALPQLSHIEVHVNSLLGRLALYDIHDRFRSDMTLSSLAESTIALPMGITCEKAMHYSPPQDILEALEQADEHYASDLMRFAGRDSVVHVRGAAVATALVSTYQASLGNAAKESSAWAARMLDMASSITLRRELVEAISFKFPDPRQQDDMQWPTNSPAQKRSRQASRLKPARGLFDDLSDDEDSSLEDGNLKKYWDHVLKKHQSQGFIPSVQTASEVDSLPKNWMVVSITLTEDKNALLVSRQRPHHEPIIFCIPLRGRRENDEDEHFTYEDAIAELKGIIQSSDEGTRKASQIKSDDREAKAAWWSERRQLDQKMKELVENIEFCWLGAFKTILSQPMQMPPDIIPSLQSRLEKVFRNILRPREKKSQKAKLKVQANLLELFSTLSSTSRDEELEDFVYFMLDLYHFYGLPIALAEVDVDVVMIDLRAALEEHHARTRGRVVPEPDEHTFLVLDKNMQGIPWESLPILRGRSVSRVPSVAFITDRLAMARCQQGLSPECETGDNSEEGMEVDRASVNPSKGYFVLNPGGDLSGTEGRFKTWANDMRKIGWEGVIGQKPSEQQYLNALSRKDLVVYFGHGGAEEYARSYKLRHLQRCAATMLWGCSSGALRDMGDFDRTGTPNNYMLAGCPTLVANLWDVTDRDIDKVALAVFGKLRIEPGEVGKWRKGKRKPQDGKVSVVSAVAQSRDACKLKYLTGAAVVVYGIPFYL